MSDNLASVITIFCFWGWIPILAIGKSIQWIICAAKGKEKLEVIKDKDVCEDCESASCNGCKY